MQNQTPPSEDELDQYIIKRLGGIADRNQLIFDVCQLMGWSWDQADLHIKAVEEQHFRRIALESSPLLIGLAIGGLVLGLASVGYSLYVLWFDYRQINAGVPAIPSPRVFYSLVIGIGMIGGALFGFYKFAGQFIRGRS